MLMKIWKDPVWSKIIATAILVLFGGIGTYFLGAWPDLLKDLIKLVEFLNSTNPVKNWVIGLALIPWLLIGFIILALIVESFKKKEPSLNWHSYTSDTFFGLKWQWSYSSNNITDIYSFCPRCQYQIFAKNVSGYIAIPHYQYACDDCGYCAQNNDVEPHELEHRVKLKIQKNIRTEEWLKQKNA